MRYDRVSQMNHCNHINGKYYKENPFVLLFHTVNIAFFFI